MQYSEPGVHRPAQAASARIFALFTFALLLSFAPQVATAQTYQVIYNFDGDASGYNPAAGMIFDSSGDLYGTTSIGGTNSGAGTVFELSHSSGWELTPLHTFYWSPTQSFGDGEDPHAPVIFGSDGNLYGTTCCGGLRASAGTVFKLTRSGAGWTEAILYRFLSGAEGAGPNSSVVFDQSGNLYGTTSSGGRANLGTVYKLSPSNGSWRETVLWSFGISAVDGTDPFSNLVFDRSGNLYGTTTSGGAMQNGTVFELMPSGSGWREKILYSFTGGSDGGAPVAGLILNPAGNLYGVASLGGSNGGGTVFELEPSGNGWEFHVIYGLNGSGSQTGPFANLAMDNAGNLFGTTYADGANHVGSVFKLTLSNGSWAYTDLHDFDGTDGEYPEGTLVLDASGNIYGTTVAGGTGTGCNATCGVAFEILGGEH